MCHQPVVWLQLSTPFNFLGLSFLISKMSKSDSMMFKFPSSLPTIPSTLLVSLSLHRICQWPQLHLLYTKTKTETKTKTVGGRMKRGLHESANSGKAFRENMCPGVSLDMRKMYSDRKYLYNSITRKKRFQI